MRKIQLILLALCYLLFNLNSIASAASLNEKAETLIEENNSTRSKIQKHKWEFSTSASLDIRKEPSGAAYDTITTISIPIRLGYFINKNFEIEPEINHTHVSEKYTFGHYSHWETLFLTNIAFNFTNSSQITPFLLGGLGIKRMPQESAIEPYREWIETYFVKNGGGGLKWFDSKRVALRIEYRYMRYKENGVYISHHKIFTGISLFF